MPCASIQAKRASGSDAAECVSSSNASAYSALFQEQMRLPPVYQPVLLVSVPSSTWGTRSPHFLGTRLVHKSIGSPMCVSTSLIRRAVRSSNVGLSTERSILTLLLTRE